MASLIKKEPLRSSSSWLGHKPSKQLEWSSYKDYLYGKYTKEYATVLYHYAVKYFDCLEDCSKILDLPRTIRSNVLKALVCLSKYLGIYSEFTTSFKNHGVRWTTQDSFSSFLKIINNDHDSLLQWYKDARSALRENERIYLRFALLSGLRRSESIKAFNKIITLSKEGKLSEYYDKDLSCLCHFKYPEFLRNTKNCFITPLAEELLKAISNSKPVSYCTIRKHLAKHNLPTRIKELRSFYATHLRKQGMMPESIDLIQGRIPKTVFARHYLKENLKELRDRTLESLKQLEQTLSS